MGKRDKPLDNYVRGRAPVQVNQTGSGPMQDKRTKRLRDRSAKNRTAIDDSATDE